METLRKHILYRICAILIIFGMMVSFARPLQAEVNSNNFISWFASLTNAEVDAAFADLSQSDLEQLSVKAVELIKSHSSDYRSPLGEDTIADINSAQLKNLYLSDKDNERNTKNAATSTNESRAINNRAPLHNSDNSGVLLQYAPKYTQKAFSHRFKQISTEILVNHSSSSLYRSVCPHKSGISIGAP